MKGERRKEENADYQHIKEKTGAAAHIHAVLLHVGNGQLFACFIGIDGLVFRTMITTRLIFRNRPISQR